MAFRYQSPREFLAFSNSGDPILLSAEDFDKFVYRCKNPEPPSDELKAALEEMQNELSKKLMCL